MRNQILFPAVLLPIALVLALAAPERTVTTYEPLGDPLNLTFKVNKIDGSDIELAMNEERVKGPLYLQFSVSVQNGTPTLTLNGAGGRSRVAGSPPRENLPNWPFLKSKEGKPVLDFEFENQLVKDAQGNPALRVKYVGTSVPLIRTMIVARPSTFPPTVSSSVGADGPVQLQAGTYQVDAGSASFTIPVKVLGTDSPR